MSNRPARRKREVLIGVFAVASTSLGWSPRVRRQGTRWSTAPRLERQGTRLWDAPPSHDSDTEDLSSILTRLRQKHGDLVDEPTDMQHAILKEENAILRETIRQLELENERLSSRASKIVIENFEGLGKFGPEWLEADNAEKDLEPTPGITMSEEEMEQMWCDELDGDTCPLEPTISFGEALRDRALWLVGLLALQSCSGFILSRNEMLLANHPVIIYFLTMLVGAGGNAGNQASVRGK